MLNIYTKDGDKMNAINSKRRIVSVLGALLVACPLSAIAQIPGDKPIKVIVPHSAGSSTDAIARILSQAMSRPLGHQLFVENIAGAGGIPGTSQLVRAPKDGLTIGMVSNNHVINPSIYKSIPYNAVKDITPISHIGGIAMVLVAHPSLPAKNVQELIALAKAKPGELNYGSSGNGTILHLTGEALKREAGGIDIKHIPYRGAGPLTIDLLGGQVQFGFLGLPIALPYIKSGQLRALGVTTKSRSPLMPELASIAEQGLPNYNLDAWITMIGPPNLPKNIVDSFYSALKTVLDQPEVKEALAAQGVTIVGNAPAVTAEFLQAELDKHTKLVKASGATIN
jgi:tripartite-type tricarboxylate transporter receptor subunit TctC